MLGFPERKFGQVAIRTIQGINIKVSNNKEKQKFHRKPKWYRKVSVQSLLNGLTVNSTFTLNCVNTEHWSKQLWTPMPRWEKKKGTWRCGKRTKSSSARWEIKIIPEAEKSRNQNTRMLLRMTRFRTCYPKIQRLGIVTILSWRNLRNDRCRKDYLNSEAGPKTLMWEQPSLYLEEGRILISEDE